MQPATYTVQAAVPLVFSSLTDLSAVPHAARMILAPFAKSQTNHAIVECLRVHTPVDEALRREVEAACARPFSEDADAYVLRRQEGSIDVYADSERGVLYGLMSFARLLDAQGGFGYTLVYDAPFSSFRGVKILMPAREEIEHFKALVDCMLYFRHNTLMLEIGGAMEYKRHPEINEGWVAYAACMSEYSGKSKQLQEYTFPWRKNSIHSNCGGGSYLTQEEVRDLVAYCNERGIEVIPEVPSTSHCDYLLTRHPELAERCEDPYPDTFCPSNPASYALLFDVLDEVIEVCRPRMINIGHDEYYSINICDRCRRRIMTNDALFAEDVTKIHDHLASRGVKTMLWCDKLMDVKGQNGMGFGGALNFVYDRWDPSRELLYLIRPTWQARERLPKDIVCMNWYWSFGEEYDEQLHEFSVVLGNFSGTAIDGYHRRCMAHGIRGGMCSDWGATAPIYLQRNRIYMAMAYNDRLFWDASYDDTSDACFAACVDNCFAQLFTYHYGPAYNRRDAYIPLLHTTDRKAHYTEFVDGIYTDGEAYRQSYFLGRYRITYTDGTQHMQDIFLGEQLGGQSYPWYGSTRTEERSDAMPGGRTVRLDARIGELAYTTRPVCREGRLMYHYLLRNPHPDKHIDDITFVKPEGANWTVDFVLC